MIEITKIKWKKKKKGNLTNPFNLDLNFKSPNNLNTETPVYNVALTIIVN